MPVQRIELKDISHFLRYYCYKALAPFKFMSRFVRPALIVLGCCLAVFVILCMIDANNRYNADRIFDELKQGRMTEACTLIQKHTWCLDYPDLAGDPRIDVHGRTKGWTMLHYAAYHDQPRIAKVLIDNDANVNVWVHGRTALDTTLVLGIGRNRTAKLLLDHDAKGNWFSAEAAYIEATNSEYYRATTAIIEALGGS